MHLLLEIFPDWLHKQNPLSYITKLYPGILIQFPWKRIFYCCTQAICWHLLAICIVHSIHSCLFNYVGACWLLAWSLLPPTWSLLVVNKPLPNPSRFCGRFHLHPPQLRWSITTVYVYVALESPTNNRAWLHGQILTTILHDWPLLPNS